MLRFYNQKSGKQMTLPPLAPRQAPQQQYTGSRPLVPHLNTNRTRFHFPQPGTEVNSTTDRTTQVAQKSVTFCEENNS